MALQLAKIGRRLGSCLSLADQRLQKVAGYKPVLISMNEALFPKKFKPVLVSRMLPEVVQETRCPFN